MNQGSRPYALTIAGFDPSGGAGILADIKTFENSGVYGLGVISALTWQNDVEFEKVEWIDYYKIAQQVGVLLRRFDIRFVKIGLVKDATVLQEIIGFLRLRIKDPVIVYDPIMKASAGYVFQENGQPELKNALRHLHCITPNLPEAKQLFGAEHLHANLLFHSSDVNIYLKGGHSEDETVSSDILFTKQMTHTFSNARLSKGEKHGSGCVLSSALTAHLALGRPIHAAAEHANKYTYQFLGSNESLLGYHKPLQQ